MLKKKYGLPIIVAVLAVSLIFVFTAASSVQQKGTEDDAVKEALTGAISTEINIGKFESADGSTATFSTDKTDKIIEAYDAEVDRYFTKDNSVNEYYKWLNKDIITRTAKDTDKINYVIDAEVPKCSITQITYSDDGNTADVQAYIMTSSRWVDYWPEDSSFHVSNPVEVEQGHYKLVKEDGTWKLKSGDGDYVSGDLTAANAVSSVSKSAAASAEKVKSAAALRDEITGSTYPDFASALDAADKLNTSVITDNLDMMTFVNETNSGGDVQN
ncbi:MAG: hypothetical protein SOV71_06085 [Anaerovoracaceae bacterium]|jgi:hypothetical protein|nr:hypothetical protein [Bacillota bacterium]MDY2671107.1 hypothetical protein [Anaerovoracaceae bacterium]